MIPPKPCADLAPGDVRVIALSILERALRALSMSDDMGTTVRREPPPLLKLQTEEELAADVRALVERVRDDRPRQRARLSQVNSLVQQILDATDINTARERLDEARELAEKLQGHGGSPVGSSGKYGEQIADGKLRLESSAPFEPHSDIKIALERDIGEETFVASVMQMCREYREESRAFGQDDELALERAYRLLDDGVRMPRNYQYIRTDDERPVQTYLSFADPGDGHLAVTVRDKNLLDGLIVHVEYIDRDNIDNPELVEAYRVPAIRNAARVRLHVGSSTPCTAFIGRPVFEVSYEHGLLKAAHTMAGVCSSMFAHGMADCKVAMDGMTAKEATMFMQHVAGNVVREKGKQRLSAAFNINKPLKNDLVPRGAPREIKDPFEIAKLAITLVRLGKFNKVAWDGASDERPSRPIIGRLSRVQLLKLVHAAHEHGLETYISAGMKAEHMRDAVFVGVGGVGIGTSLHRVSDDGTIGPINQDAVEEVLRVQRKAFKDIGGQAARWLARLDWKHAEGTLPGATERLRNQLFVTLEKDLDSLDQAPPMSNLPGEVEQALRDLLEQIDNSMGGGGRGGPMRVMSTRGLTPESRGVGEGAEAWFSDPVVGWAVRVIDAHYAGVNLEGDGAFSEDTINQIRKMLEAGDIHGLRRLYPF